MLVLGGLVMNDLYPIKMSPVFKDYLWGGEKLKTTFKKPTPYDITAESWEVAVHKNGKSKAENGEFKGKTIDEISAVLGEKLLGKENADKPFPLMLKLIDAKDNLSVQVHPTDGYAKAFENSPFGKTEMWYILDAEPNSSLIYGFKKDMNKQEFENAINENKLKDVLNFVDVKKGDCFLIPAGTVHAIGKGIVLAEIQQNSDLTYRVYDWGRVDKNGNSRPLHIEKAIAVSNLSNSKGKEKQEIKIETKENYIKKTLCENKYFIAEEYQLNGELKEKSNHSSFSIFLFLGDAEIEGIKAKNGDSFLIPADLKETTIKGNCSFLKFYTK